MTDTSSAADQTLNVSPICLYVMDTRTVVTALTKNSAVGPSYVYSLIIPCSTLADYNGFYPLLVGSCRLRPVKNRGGCLSIEFIMLILYCVL